MRSIVCLNGQSFISRREDDVYKVCQRFGELEYNEIDKCMEKREQVEG